MHEKIPLNPETSGATLLRTLDIIFEAAICGVYAGENAAELKKLGFVIAYGIDEDVPDKDVLIVFNWDTEDVFKIFRAERGIDISEGLPFPVRFQLKHTDILNRELRVPFTVNGEAIDTENIQFAITDKGILVPWIEKSMDDGGGVLCPELDACNEAQIENMLDFLKFFGARHLINMYLESDDPLAELQI